MNQHVNNSALNLTGLIPPMITPLTESGQVDPTGIEGHVDFLLNRGVDGIFVLGSSGEGPWLTHEQNEDVIVHTIRAVDGRVPVLAGVLEPSASRAISAIQPVADAGADAIVATLPYYFDADETTYLKHFELIADNSPLPVVLYNIPPMTYSKITVAIVSEVAQHDNIIGIKDSSGDMEGFHAMLKLHETNPDFKVMQGAERYMAESLLSGADAIVPGLGNVAPQLFAQIIASARAGDTETVLALQEQIDSLWELHGYAHWLICLKYAASLAGIVGRTATCRNDGLSEEGKSAIQDLVLRYATAER